MCVPARRRSTSSLQGSRGGCEKVLRKNEPLRMTACPRRASSSPHVTAVTSQAAAAAYCFAINDGSFDDEQDDADRRYCAGIRHDRPGRRDPQPLTGTERHRRTCAAPGLCPAGRRGHDHTGAGAGWRSRPASNTARATSPSSCSPCRQFNAGHAARGRRGADARSDRLSAEIIAALDVCSKISTGRQAARQELDRSADHPRVASPRHLLVSARLQAATKPTTRNEKAGRTPGLGTSALSQRHHCETVWITLEIGRALVIVVGSFGSWPTIASYSGSVSSVPFAFIATTL